MGARTKTPPTESNGAGAPPGVAPDRTVLPRGYHAAELRLEGTSPLLMSSGEFDVESETYQAFEALSRKKSRTKDDGRRLAELEWALRLYMDEELGPYWPARNLRRLIRDGATRWNQGQNVYRALRIVPFRAPLIYQGPRDQEGLWAGGFRYTAMVANSGRSAGRVQRTRPMFPEWSVEVELVWDAEELDDGYLARAVERSRIYGVGDYRSEKGGDFGQFVPYLGPIRELVPPVDGDGLTPVDELEREAHERAVARVRGS